MRFENFIKGPLTTLLGFCLIIAAAVAWLTDYLNNITDWQALWVAGAGFGLMFMRDDIHILIKKFVEKKIGPNDKTLS